MSQQDATEPPTRPEPGAIRLVFEYAGDEVRLVSRERVDMLVPPAAPLEGDDEQVGVWAEVQAADGATLNRQVLHNPIRRDVEVFSDNPRQSIVRSVVERPAGVFFVVVPDIEGADDFVLLGAPTGAPERRAAATEIIRVPLR